MKNSLNQIKVAKIAATALVMTIAGLAYYQYQAYETEKKLDIGRKQVGERVREQSRLLAEEIRKHPIIIPDDPLAPQGNPLGDIPSDAEEMAQLKLWHQSPPEQRKKLVPTPGKLPILNPELLLKEQLKQMQSEQLSDDPNPNPIQQQALLAIQQQALVKKSKQN